MTRPYRTRLARPKRTLRSIVPTPSHRHRVALAACLAAAVAVGPAGAAPTAASPAKTLLDQSFFWGSQQPQRAIYSLDRLLRLDPDNATALALLAQIDAEQGLPEPATALLARLAATHPGDPRIGAVQAALRVGPLDQDALQDARARAAARDFSGAVAAYRRAFNGAAPPDIFAREYDATLQAIDKPLPEGPCCTHQTEAWQSLDVVAKRYPDITNLALAAAVLETYDEGARPDGIDLLAQLAQNPEIAEIARQDWRSALLWQGASPRAQQQLEDYLSRYPSDPALDAERADFRRSLPTDAQRALWQGYADLQDGNVAEAEKQFAIARTDEPQNPDPLRALAILREHQKRLPDARKLIDQAIALAPDQKDELLKVVAVSGDNGAAVQAIRRDYSQIKRLTDTGSYPAAEAALARLKGSKPPAGYYVELGSIQQQAGDSTAAEASFRTALALHPGEPPALRAIARLQSNKLRDQAASVNNTAERERLLRRAIAADAGNPWARLALARLLSDQGRRASADRVMLTVAVGPQPAAEDIQAALIWADDRNDLALAARLIRLVPKTPTPLIRRLAQRIAVAEEIDRARAEFDPEGQRSRLLEVAAQPDPTGVRGLAVANAFLRLDDKTGAREAIVRALRSTPDVSSEQLLAYIKPLIDAGHSADARVLASRIDPHSLSASLLPAYRGTIDGLAINRADELNQQRKDKQAFRVLAKQLQSDPVNTELNLAVGRVYQTRGEYNTALQIGEWQMRREPGNLDAQRSAVEAAISAGDLGLAARIAGQAVKSAPRDPRSYLMQGEVADARQDKRGALEALRTAQALRQQQLADHTADDMFASP